MDLNPESEDEEDWSSCVIQAKRPLDQNASFQSHKKARIYSPPGRDHLSTCMPTSSTSSNDIMHSVKGHDRTIIHIDIDCFYAQVETVLNPIFEKKPLGIQQKHIVVTCNYIARERGLTKLMRVSDAKKKCPDLVLVNGEDLKKYRDFSKRINELLLGITPNVERLGFDENFLDVTNLVQERLLDDTYNNALEPLGFVYGHSDGLEKCSCGCHRRLVIGTQIASELRQMIFEQIGLTCCAGISYNKILAKLVGECNKPNKQTVLFPKGTKSFMEGLQARKIPGIGSSFAKRLQSIGITTVVELQCCSIEVLTAEFGDGPQALNFKRLSYGIDDSDVVPSGSPKSISEEDTYHECFSLNHVTKNLEKLIAKLVSRLNDELGSPQTVRLTIRKGIGELAGDRKESRQCNIPANVSSQGVSEIRKKDILLSVTLDLFKKLINVNQTFNIKLLNVCLTKFHKISKHGKFGLNNFFNNRSNNIIEVPKDTTSPSCDNEKPTFMCHSDKVNAHDHSNSLQQKQKQGTTTCDKPASSSIADDETIPNSIDKDVFNSLPVEIQSELVQEWKQQVKDKVNKTTNRNNKKDANTCGLLKYFKKK